MSTSCGEIHNSTAITSPGRISGLFFSLPSHFFFPSRLNWNSGPIADSNVTHCAHEENMDICLLWKKKIAFKLAEAGNQICGAFIMFSDPFPFPCCYVASLWWNENTYILFISLLFRMLRWKAAFWKNTFLPIYWMRICKIWTSIENLYSAAVTASSLLWCDATDLHTYSILSILSSSVRLDEDFQPF